MLIRAQQTDLATALSLCSRLPTRPLQVAAWIHEGGLVTPSHLAVTAFRTNSDSSPINLRTSSAVPSGSLYLESQGEGLAFVSELGVVMPHLKHSNNVEELARRLGPSARVIQGPSWATKTLWTQLQQQGSTARIIRDQVSYTVDRTTFKDKARWLTLKKASSRDLDAVVDASAAMAIEESNDDPARRNPSLFRTRIRERLKRRRDFVYTENGKLLFKACVSAMSPYGGHLEGVYTLPSARNQGIGRAGVAWVTRWILKQSPRATLLVNEDNLGAQRIYEALGFVPSYPSRTILAE